MAQPAETEGTRAPEITASVFTLTKRELFAALLMAGSFGTTGTPPASFSDYADDAVRGADALILMLSATPERVPQ